MNNFELARAHTTEQARELLAEKPKPTDTDIDKTMSTVLCRCGTYRRIRRAIHRAAEEMGHE